MLFENWITECDMTGEKFDKPVLGFHVFNRDESGKVTCTHYAARSAFPTAIANTLGEIKKWAESIPGGFLDY